MPDITDETIKKKHKEFNDQIKTMLEQLRNPMGQGFSPNIQKLRQTAQLNKPLG